MRSFLRMGEAGAPGLLLLGALLFPSPGFGTDLEGALSGSLPAGTYRVVDDIYVPAGESLVLAPGVVFQFEESFWEQYEFDVLGILDAQGTATEPIVFQTAPGVGEFNYIRIADGGSVLRHCVIERAGKILGFDEGGLWIDRCSPRIEGCTVRDGSWHGIYLTGSGARPEIRETTVVDHAADGISGDAGAGLIAVNCTVTGNGGDGICLSDGSNTIVGCLVTGNGEDGVDCRGIDDFPATLINCTISDNGSENLSDTSRMELFNTIVVGRFDGISAAAHSYLIADAGFFRFVDRPGGDYRLAPDSPCRNRGTRFGPPGDWLPGNDLDGNPRPNGIVDIGAFESTDPPDPGESGIWFSDALISPRMTQPAICAPGESFLIRIGLLGDYSPSEVGCRLVSPLGGEIPGSVRDLTASDVEPGGGLAVLLHTPGVETIQEVTVEVPAGTPSGLYDLGVDVGPYTFQSVHAVAVVDGYPSSWSFIQITDTHVGYADEEYTAAERLRFFAREANFVHPDFVVVTGDICENQNLENEAYVDSFLAVISTFRVPVFVLPGNHDRYNEAGDTNPYGYFRYFQRINRYRNAAIRFGGAWFFALDSGHDLGLEYLYRCLGPTDGALDWAEAVLSLLDPQTDRPRFLLMHGPNYDWVSFNVQNTGRVRDLIDAYGIGLCLAGHTHRFETYRNEGENWFGRDDYSHEDDWGRDVPFPGFPLHVQTSALGKEEQIPADAAAPVPVRYDPDRGGRGIFGDGIGFRVVRVDQGEVTFFTADTDGDGYRNTEDAWPLGEIEFEVVEDGEGVIVSTVENRHFEIWTDARHFVPADAGQFYRVTGGTIVRRYPDGTIEVAVDSVAAQSVSMVVLTPAPAAADDLESLCVLSLRALRNPFSDATELRMAWSAAGPAPRLELFDPSGRLVRSIPPRGTVRWDGRDDRGRPLPAGLYFARLAQGPDRTVVRLVKTD